MIVIPLLFKSRDFLGTQITHSGQKNKKCQSPYLVSAKTLKKRLQSVIQYSSILLSFSSLSGRPKYMSILSINDTKLMLLVAGWLSTADSDSNNFASSSWKYKFPENYRNRCTKMAGCFSLGIVAKFRV